MKPSKKYRIGLFDKNNTGKCLPIQYPIDYLKDLQGVDLNKSPQYEKMCRKYLKIYK